MNVILAGTVRFPPERMAEARERMKEMMRLSRAEDGCIEYVYAEDLEEPGLVRVFEVWRDEAGRAHIRGSVTRFNISSAGVVFVLPPELRPRRLLGFPVGTGATAGVHPAGVAMVAIYPSGAVSFFSMSQGTDAVFHLGEIVFTIDQ